MKLFFRIIRSIIYVPAFIFFFGWIAGSVRVFDDRTGILLPVWLRIPGIIFMIAGGIIILTCVTEFITRGKGTPAAFDPPVEFVATGPYAYVRNPMYIGGFVLLVGYGLYCHSPSILLLTVILILLLHLFVVFYEEPTLKRLFGNSYAEYKSHINRWIPKRKKIDQQTLLVTG